MIISYLQLIRFSVRAVLRRLVIVLVCVLRPHVFELGLGSLCLRQNPGLLVFSKSTRYSGNPGKEHSETLGDAPRPSFSTQQQKQ